MVKDVLFTPWRLTAKEVVDQFEKISFSNFNKPEVTAHPEMLGCAIANELTSLRRNLIITYRAIGRDPQALESWIRKKQLAFKPAEEINFYRRLQRKFATRAAGVKRISDKLRQMGIIWLPAASTGSHSFPFFDREVAIKQLNCILNQKYKDTVELFWQLAKSRLQGSPKAIEDRLKTNRFRFNNSFSTLDEIGAALRCILIIQKNIDFMNNREDVLMEFQNLRSQIQENDYRYPLYRRALAGFGAVPYKENTNFHIESAIIRGIETIPNGNAIRKELSLAILKTDLDAFSLWYLYKSVSNCDIYRFAIEFFQKSNHLMACIDPEIWLLPIGESAFFTKPIEPQRPQKLFRFLYQNINSM